MNNPGTTPLQGNFHTYALQWSPAGYQFYIDGTQVYSTAQAVSGRSHFIYLTSEVQNASWAGSIPAGGYGSLAASTTKMVVDWVRVWQRPVSNVPDQVLNENGATPALPVTVTQRDGLTTTVTAASSNPDLIPDGNLTLGGSGANRTLTVRPAAGQTGTATVTVTAGNGTVSGSDTFTVTVHAGSFRNAGFEEDAAGAGWGRYGGAQVTATGARSGGRAMRIVGSGGAEQVVTGLRPNTTYTLSGYARVTAAGTPASIGVKNYGGAQRSVTLSGTSYAPGTVTFTTGPTATEATVFVYKPTAVNDGYFDDLTLFAAANRAPVLAQPADRTVPSTQDVVTVALSAADPDGDALTYTAAAQSLAYVLDQQLGLFTGGNVYEDYGGRGEKWVQGAANEWYFLLPNGELYLWDGGAGAAGTLVNRVGASYHVRLDLLYNAALAFDLDAQLGLFSDGNLFTNYGGRGEKWLQGSGGAWYFITPGGELSRWDGTPDRATGTLVAAPGTSFHADPALLFNAAVNPHAALSVAGTTLTIDREDGFVGALVVTVTASDGRLTDSKTFHVFVTA